MPSRAKPTTIFETEEIDQYKRGVSFFARMATAKIAAEAGAAADKEAGSIWPSILTAYQPIANEQVVDTIHLLYSKCHITGREMNDLLTRDAFRGSHTVRLTDCRFDSPRQPTTFTFGHHTHTKHKLQSGQPTTIDLQPSLSISGAARWPLTSTLSKLNTKESGIYQKHRDFMVRLGQVRDVEKLAAEAAGETGSLWPRILASSHLNERDKVCRTVSSLNSKACRSRRTLERLLALNSIRATQRSANNTIRVPAAGSATPLPAKANVKTSDSTTSHVKIPSNIKAKLPTIVRWLDEKYPFIVLEDGNMSEENAQAMFPGLAKWRSIHQQNEEELKD
ncbi:hypothetical protein B7494_g1758 [Chlorociboria aeruginascens]|nr:hypothetical protein B7494_g1758 [Chlorociboria aeruginascens]